MPSLGRSALPLRVLRRLRGPREPKTHIHEKVIGLHAPIEILRDRWGVPHIYAANLDDLLFGQGYVHAQDRLWQMEINRRIGHGRLAEILGLKALELDRLLRTVGFSRAARTDLAALEPATRQALEAYAAGVNARLTSVRRLPLEFRLLRFRPEPWQPTDTLGWGKVIAWALSINWTSEVLRSAVISRLGPERAARLESDYPPDNPVILPDQAAIQMFAHILAQFQTAEHWLPLPGPVGTSNNWVVDGIKSATGRPLLANDPHLTASLPAIWYENHLDSPELAAAGVSMPGAPGVAIGHNADIAWGVTAAFPDVQDLYLERAHPEQPTLYEYEGRWEPARVVREEIRVRGHPAHTIDVIITRHGPVVSRLLPFSGGPEPPPVSLRWTAYEPGRLPSALLALNQAADWSDFCAALADWHDPALNFVYADRHGNIGYYLAGRVPLRSRGLGLVPVPGWTSEHEWLGWIPHEELPHALNPVQHYFASANNQVAGREYPHFLSIDTASGFRAQRIAEMLESQERLADTDFARMQVDLSCERSARPLCRLLVDLTPRLLAHPAVHPVREQAGEALTYIDRWDYTLAGDSVAAALYEAVQHFAMRRVFSPWLGELTEHYLGLGFDRFLDPVIFASLDRTPLVLRRILVGNEREWFVDDAGRALEREDVLALALADAIGYLSQHLGRRVARWRWGRVHQVRFHHTLSSIRPLHRLFNRGPYPYGGDSTTVWQASFIPRLPIDPDVAITASWRQIIDVGEWDASLGVLPPGQSGLRRNRHYDDQIPLWLHGQYHPLLWTRERIEAAVEEKLILRP